MTSARSIVVFSRFPEPGRVKSRLIDALGPRGAAELHRELTEHTLQTVAQATDEHVSAELRSTGGRPEQWRAWLGGRIPRVDQGDGDLGERLARALSDGFEAGLRRMVIVGCDCPDLSAAVLGEALDGLSETDLMLGPATDGGYYLIGLRREVWQPHGAELFHDIRWGTSSVLAATRERARAIGVRWRELVPLSDVDRPEDLPVWERHRAGLSPRAGGPRVP